MRVEIPEELKEYVNREVAVTVVKKKAGEGAHTFEYDAHESNDPILKELEQKILAAGFKPQVFLPDQCGTMDYRTDRIRVHVHPVDGKFVIASICVG